MTATEHLNDLAQRYAKALVDYRRNPSNDNYETMCELQQTMFDVAGEVAAEDEA